MNILYVLTRDIYENTSGNIRNAALIQGFASLGHTVKVLCIHAGKPADNTMRQVIDRSAEVYVVAPPKDGEWTFSVSEAKKDESLKAKLRKTVISTYNRFKVYDAYRYGIQKFNPVEFDFGKIDLVISSSDPRSSHLFAQKVMKSYNFHCPWVQYWGDPMSNDISAGSFMNHFLPYFEKKLIKSCDLAVYTNPIVAEHLAEIYPAYKNKLTWVPTSFPADDDAAKTDTIEYDVGYFGDYLQAYRDIRPLIESLKHNGMSACICGKGDIEIRQDEKIHVYGKVPLTQAEAFKAKCEILVILANETSTEKRSLQIPGKLYHYALSNKPILFLTNDSTVEKYYGGYNRFVFAENNVNTISKALRNIKNGVYSDTAKPLNDFTPTHVAQEFLNKVKELNNHG